MTMLRNMPKEAEHQLTSMKGGGDTEILNVRCALCNANQRFCCSIIFVFL